MSIFRNLADIRNQNKSQYYFILLVCAFWCNACFLDFGTVVVDKLLRVTNSRTIIIPALFLYLTSKSETYWGKTVKSKDYLFVILSIFIYLSNYVLFPTNEERLSQYLPSFLYAILFYLVGVSADIRTLKPYLYLGSIANLLCSAFYNLVFIHASGYAGGSLEVGESVHDMPQAYYVLPSVIYIIWITLENFHFKDIFKIGNVVAILLSVLGFVLESSFGTRGPLVCIVVFVVLYILFVKVTRHQMIYRTIAVASGAIAYQFLDVFLLFMAGITESLGMSNRVFMLALNGTFTSGENSSDERLYMSKQVYQELQQNDLTSIFGHGLTGFWDRLGGYPHNLIYEMLLSFGFLFGGILLLYLVYLLTKAFIRDHSSTSRGFVLVLFSCSVVKLMMSSTFLSEAFFYMLIGYCIYVKRQNKILTQ